MLDLTQCRERQFDRRNITSAEIRGFGRVFLISRNIVPQDWVDRLGLFHMYRCEIFGHGLHARGFGQHSDRSQALRCARNNALESFCLSSGLLPSLTSDSQLLFRGSTQSQAQDLQTRFAYLPLTNVAEVSNRCGVASADSLSDVLTRGRNNCIKHSILTLLPFDEQLCQRFKPCPLDELQHSTPSAHYLLNKGYAFRLLSAQLDSGHAISYAGAYSNDVWPNYVFGSAIDSDLTLSRVAALKDLMLILAAQLDTVLQREQNGSRQISQIPQLKQTHEITAPQNSQEHWTDAWASTPIDQCFHQPPIQIHHDNDAPAWITRTLVPLELNTPHAHMTLPIQPFKLAPLFKSHRL